VIVAVVLAVVGLTSTPIPNTGNLVGDLVVYGVLLLFVVFIAVLIGTLVGGPIGAGLGAFIVLKVRGHQAPGWTGLAVGLAQLLVTPVGLFVGALSTRSPKVVAGVLVTLLVILTIALPAMIGRGLVLLVRRQFIWPWVDIFG